MFPLFHPRAFKHIKYLYIKLLKLFHNSTSEQFKPCLISTNFITTINIALFNNLKVDNSFLCKNGHPKTHKYTRFGWMLNIQYLTTLMFIPGYVNIIAGEYGRKWPCRPFINNYAC